MKKLTMLLITTTIIGLSASTHAAWVKYGHWMHSDERSVTGSGFWDKSIMFDAFKGDLQSRKEMHDELKQIQNIAGGNYRNLDKTRQKIIQRADSQLQKDLSGFSLHRTDVHYERYISDKSHMQVFFFAHKTDMHVKAKVFMGFNSFNDLINAKLDGESYIKGCQSQNSYRATCKDRSYSRLSNTTVQRLAATLKKAYGFNLNSAPKNTLFLYDNIGNEIYVVVYHNGYEAKARILMVNLNNYATAKPVDIKELPNI